MRRHACGLPLPFFTRGQGGAEEAPRSSHLCASLSFSWQCSRRVRRVSAGRGTRGSERAPHGIRFVER